jgi:hypothetical protein
VVATDVANGLTLVNLAELRRGGCPMLAMDSETGQTALHIAVMHSADLKVIRRLTVYSTLAASSMHSFTWLLRPGLQ